MVTRKGRMSVPDRYCLNRAREWIIQTLQGVANQRKLPSGKKTEVRAVAWEMPDLPATFTLAEGSGSH